ncbi:alpha/beta fold hydrolase [Salinirarus marinus]|uniref:alpha/beta fold hydrolase n=1 Tax=Salinirarus marinus TaxID=3068310 RepID=UPI003C6BF449
MKLRRAIGYAALGVGAATGVHRLLRGRAGDLEPALDGDQHTYRWRGMNVAFTAAGDPDDPTLVLLHGVNVAGSSGEFREVFDRLADRYRVVVPDLPGFGRSDRPPLRYSAALYEDFVAAFLDRFDEPAVVASSLAGAYVARAAERTEVSGLVLVCPTAVAGPDPPAEWLRELLRAPVVGSALFDLVASKPSIRYFGADHGYYDTDHVTESWTDYQWRTTHQPNARFAPASFVSGYLNSDVDLGDALSRIDAPVTVVWGVDADPQSVERGRDLAAEADARLVTFENAKLLPHVEHPERFVDVVGDALRATA